MVTASPMDGFLLVTAEALNALVERLMRDWFLLATSFDNIFRLSFKIILNIKTGGS